MACEIYRSESGEVVAIVCGSPWGIGVYTHCHDSECGCGGEAIYGFPPKRMNPHDFSPDPECCSDHEIEAWKEAVRVFDDAVARGQNGGTS